MTILYCLLWFLFVAKPAKKCFVFFSHWIKVLQEKSVSFVGYSCSGTAYVKSKTSFDPVFFSSFLKAFLSVCLPKAVNIHRKKKGVDSRKTSNFSLVSHLISFRICANKDYITTSILYSLGVWAWRNGLCRVHTN